MGNDAREKIQNRGPSCGWQVDGKGTQVGVTVLCSSCSIGERVYGPHFIMLPSLLQFLSLHTVDILDCIVLCWGDYTVYHRMFSSISDLCALGTSSTTPPSCGSKKCLQRLPNIPEKQN